ncbi:FkbM family methyltransferase [Roseomonas sp. PWR1]|uniref:FkbM family methyltransferase n=1 Tax=Roseomonas nitratireducens TaxID=2820810 RepID=A0ABS4AR31_9PROT|nr:FkbM family methyltransferase [Neoroseomonas nitratireducens]MBP0463818.1 FkbM family methyltransferase [Neoroseomonas nitratireducens]
MSFRHAAKVPVAISNDAARLEVELRNDTSSRLVLREVFEHGTYAPIPGAAAPRAILDVGANQGITAAFFRLAYPEATIVCVEPDPATFPILAENARRIGRCTAHQVALLDRDGQAPFASSSISVVSTLYDLPAPGIANERVDVALRHAGRFAEEAATAIGCAGFDLLKIDTEGAELPILRALGGLLAEVGTVHLEYHSLADRAAIEALLAPTHTLARERVDAPERGTLSFLRRPAATLHGAETKMA